MDRYGVFLRYYHCQIMEWGLFMSIVDGSKGSFLRLQLCLSYTLSLLQANISTSLISFHQKVIFSIPNLIVRVSYLLEEKVITLSVKRKYP